MSVIAGYQRSTAVTEKKEAPPVEEDAGHFQARMSWLASDVSKEMFKELLEKSNGLLTEAMSLAMSNSQCNNEKQIVSKLIQAHTLKKVVDKYAQKSNKIPS